MIQDRLVERQARNIRATPEDAFNEDTELLVAITREEPLSFSTVSRSI